MQLLSKVYSVTFVLFVKLNKNKTILWAKKTKSRVFDPVKVAELYVQGGQSNHPLTKIFDSASSSIDSELGVA